MACVGKHEGRGEPEAREGHIFRSQVAAYSGANGTQLLCLQRCIRFQWVEGLVRGGIYILDARRAPFLPFPEEAEAHRDPGGSAGGEDPDYARRKVPKG